ncbi:Fe/S biogenesis protein nfuA [Slackia heliotrinireducens]|nr:Fe/S biogenesis protein nfuA [Slackia heliotrinireducens]
MAQSGVLTKIMRTTCAEGRIIMAVDRERIERVLELIRPSLQADGGDLELVDVGDDGVVTVHLTGACNGCPLSQLTLANGVRRVLKERVPSVTDVRAV